MIVDMRTDSLFDNFDYEIASEIHLDLAGEFAPESKEFQQVAHELGIQLKYASPHDKRTNNHAENAVKVIEIKTKASMATFNTPVQWWSHVATSVATILNLTAMTKNMVDCNLSDAVGGYDPWRRPAPKRDFILSLGFALQRANVRMLRGSSLRRRQNRAKDCFASGSRSQ